MGSERNSHGRATIAVAVEPPILSEALGRALRAAAFDVVVLQPDRALTVSHYDLAVVTGKRVVDFAAAVIRLPDDGTGSGTAHSARGVEVVDIGDVAAFVDVVRRLV